MKRYIIILVLLMAFYPFVGGQKGCGGAIEMPPDEIGVLEEIAPDTGATLPGEEVPPAEKISCPEELGDDFTCDQEVNADGTVNIADAISTLSYLFGGGVPPSCPDASDANDDGNVDVADAIATLGFLFGGAAPLPEPFEECGADPTEDKLECAVFPPCQ